MLKLNQWLKSWRKRRQLQKKELTFFPFWFSGRFLNSYYFGFKWIEKLTLMELSVLSKHKSAYKNQKSAQKTKPKKKSLTIIQFPDADIHKWVEGCELLILISPPIKCKPAQQWKFPGKQGFFLVLKQPLPKCSSLQPTALMDAALLSFPGDSSQHYSSFSRSNQSSRASSCCCLVYSPLWSNPKEQPSPYPTPTLYIFFFLTNAPVPEGLELCF